MFQYIVKRLLLMVVTLFGITLITFVVTRLAPGDPASLRVQAAVTGSGRGQQLSEAIIEENRRILGLDKPIIVNLHPKGRVEHIRDWMKEMRSTEEYIRDRARRALQQIGTVALPDVMAAIESPATTEPLRTRLVDALPGIVNVTTPEGFETSSTAVRLQWWRDWWRDNRSRYSPGHARQLVEAYYAQPTEENFKKVTDIGPLAVPFLIDRLDSFSSPTVDRATGLLSTILGRPWSNEQVKEPDARAQNLYRWHNWWNYHRPEYVEFGRFEEFVRTFTDTQFGVWFGKMVTFDFDESYTHRRPVLEVVKERLPISIQLALISIFLSYVIAIPLGIFSATHQFSLTDKIITTFLFMLYSLPSFWLADMLILFVTEHIGTGSGAHFWQFFPLQGLHSPGYETMAWWPWIKDWVWHLVLPIACLTYASLAFLSRQMRVSMLETIRQDFIRTAQAKGLSRRAVVLKHALRNSLIPILTLSAALLPELLGGSVIIETIFGIEGMGKLTVDSIMNRDYAVINAIAFFSAFLTLLGILISDLSYALVDPRIRYE